MPWNLTGVQRFSKLITGSNAWSSSAWADAAGSQAFCIAFFSGESGVALTACPADYPEKQYGKIAVHTQRRRTLWQLRI